MKNLIRRWLGIEHDVILENMVNLAGKTHAVIRSQAVQTDMYRDLSKRLVTVEMKLGIDN